MKNLISRLGVLILTIALVVCSLHMLQQSQSVMATDINPYPITEDSEVLSDLFYPQTYDAIPESLADIEGTAFVLYDTLSRSVVMGRNETLALSPASVTKVLTVLFALENLDLSTEITIRPEMHESIPEDYTTLPVETGEIFTVEQLVHAALLKSANDAALALALTMAPDNDTFSAMLNDRAIEMGCANTHFTNAYGFSDPQHLTSARDLAIMLAEALKNETFAKISTMPMATIPPTNLSEEAKPLYNQSRLINNNDGLGYAPYIGGKTGYTDLSRYTLAAGAEKNGKRFVGVILGSTDSTRRYQDMIRLLDYGFATYKHTQVSVDALLDMKRAALREIDTTIANTNPALVVSHISLYYRDILIEKSGGNGLHDLQPVVDSIEVSDLASQVLSIPIQRENSLGEKETIGRFTFTILNPDMQGMVSSTDMQADQSVNMRPNPNNTWVLVIRTLVILLGISILILMVLIGKEIQIRRKA